MLPKPLWECSRLLLHLHILLLPRWNRLLDVPQLRMLRLLLLEFFWRLLLLLHVQHSIRAGASYQLPLPFRTIPTSEFMRYILLALGIGVSSAWGLLGSGAVPSSLLSVSAGLLGIALGVRSWAAP